MRILSIGWGSDYTNQNIPYGHSSAKLPVIMSSCLLSFIFNVTADGQTNEQHQVLEVCFADNKLKNIITKAREILNIALLVLCDML